MFCGDRVSFFSNSRLFVGSIKDGDGMIYIVQLSFYIYNIVLERDCFILM
jgi:hypothetical protein